MSGIFKKEIKKVASGRIFFDEPMSKYTSMGVGGNADFLLFPESVGELSRIISLLTEHHVPYMPVGNCTNLIVRDGGFRGALISLKGLHKLEIKTVENKNAHIYAEAGVSLSRMVELSVKESLSGMEFCAGIPGSVGGGIKMNAGAYGKELKDTIDTISLINNSGKFEDHPRKYFCCTYRNIDLPKDSIIISAVFNLTRGSKVEVKTKIADLLEKRKGKHPLQYRNAGSVFKNPLGIPAGKIIDNLGLKGLKIGNAEISEKHGNFIVNSGNAKACDIIDLISIIQDKVMDHHGINLEIEVKIIGDD